MLVQYGGSVSDVGSAFDQQWIYIMLLVLWFYIFQGTIWKKSVQEKI